MRPGLVRAGWCRPGDRDLAGRHGSGVLWLSSCVVSRGDLRTHLLQGSASTCTTILVTEKNAPSLTRRRALPLNSRCISNRRGRYSGRYCTGTKPAETALQRSAYAEAIAHLTQGSDTPQRPAAYPLSGRSTTHAHSGVGRAARGHARYAAPEVAQVYTRGARTLSPAWRHRGALSGGLAALAVLFGAGRVIQTARELGEECLSLAGDDTTALLVAHYALALSLFYLGEFGLTRRQRNRNCAVQVPSNPSRPWRRCPWV